MPWFKVQGVLSITYLVDVNTEVESETEEEALESVTSDVAPGRGYESTRQWLGDSPTVYCLEDSDGDD